MFVGRLETIYLVQLLTALDERRRMTFGSLGEFYRVMS